MSERKGKDKAKACKDQVLVLLASDPRGWGHAECLEWLRSRDFPCSLMWDEARLVASVNEQLEALHKTVVPPSVPRSVGQIELNDLATWSPSQSSPLNLAGDDPLDKAGPLLQAFNASLQWPDIFSASEGRNPISDYLLNLRTFIHQVDQGGRAFIMEDPKQDEGMVIFVKEVRQLRVPVPFKAKAGERVGTSLGLVGRIARISKQKCVITIESNYMNDQGNAVEVYHTELTPLLESGNGNICFGSQVLICGLQSEKGKQLNGRLGVVQSPAPAGARVSVQVDGEKDAMSIKRENLEVVRPPKHLPVVVLLFCHSTAADPNSSQAFVDLHNIARSHDVKSTNKLVVLLRQLQFFYRSLHLNAARLHSSVTAAFRDQKLTHEGWRVSIMIPPDSQPLAADVKKKALKKARTCRVCNLDNKRLRACARCNGVSYCGQQCQKADWKRHRVECISPESDSGSEDCDPSVLISLSYDFGLPISLGEGVSVVDGRTGKIHDPTKIPSNAHGDREFIVKVQGPIVEPWLNVRDEILQVNVQLNPSDSAYSVLFDAVQRNGSPGKINGKKLYCRCRRVGPKIRVFYQKLPQLTYSQRW